METVEKMRLVSFEHKSEKYFLESIKKKSSGCAKIKQHSGVCRTGHALLTTFNLFFIYVDTL